MFPVVGMIDSSIALVHSIAPTINRAVASNGWITLLIH
jgi:hypothetical protein